MILDANLQINLKTAKESYYFFLQTFTERCFLTKTAVAALPVWENSHRYNIINKVCTLFDDYLMTIDDEDTLGGILHTTALQVVNHLVVPVNLLVSLHLEGEELARACRNGTERQANAQCTRVLNLARLTTHTVGT